MKKNFRKITKNCNNNLKNSSGITLIAFVITIIVLLILAGVSLSMVFNSDGLFSRTNKTADEYNKAKARETLESALSNTQMIKYGEGLTEEKLDQKLGEVGALLPKENETTNIQQVIVDGYIFEIDRSVPKIIKYIDKAQGVIITSTISGGLGWVKPGGKATLTGTIKSYSGARITKVSATQNGVEITKFALDGDSYKIDNITTDTTFIIKGEDSKGNKKEKEIQVNIKIDGTAPTVDSVTANVDKRKINISATGNDKNSAGEEQSGINKFYYKISPTNGIPENKVEGSFNSGETIEITAGEAREYTITVTADDKVGNKATTEKTANVETLGQIKHIKTAQGFKEVNTIDIYGATVNGYACDRTDIGWQIFYIDETKDNVGKVTDSQVYLIANDYAVPPVNSSTVTPKLLPGGNSSYPKAYRFGTDTSTGILGKYTTAIPEKGNITVQEKFMEKYLSDYAGVSAKSTPNLQATSYMLNQDVWGEYKGIKADLAFGGPTLTLFQASYNDICESSKKIEIKKSGTGYQVKQGGGSFDIGFGEGGDTSTQKGIYFFGNTSNSADGMWFASPSTSANYNVLRANCRGAVSASNYGSEKIGFRPVVCLQSGVQFTANSNGSYTIS